MSDLTTAILPFFAVVLIGYAAARFSILSTQEILGINRFVYFFGLPALLFDKMSDAAIDKILAESGFILAYVSSGVAVFAIGWFGAQALFRAEPANRAIVGLAACYGNIGFLGIPVLVSVLGSWVAVPLSIMLLIDAGLFIPLAVTVIALSRAETGTAAIWRSALLSIVTNPLILAILAGTIVAASGLEMPRAVAGLTDLLGRTAGPAGMFALGAVLAGRPLSDGFGEAFLSSLLKLCLFPFITWWAMSSLGISEEWRLAATLGAASPIAAALFVIAQENHAMPVRASTATVMSTALSMLTIPLVLSWLT